MAEGALAKYHIPFTNFATRLCRHTLKRLYCGLKTMFWRSLIDQKYTFFKLKFFYFTQICTVLKEAESSLETKNSNRERICHVRTLPSIQLNVWLYSLVVSASFLLSCFFFLFSLYTHLTLFSLTLFLFTLSFSLLTSNHFYCITSNHEISTLPAWFF